MYYFYNKKTISFTFKPSVAPQIQKLIKKKLKSLGQEKFHLIMGDYENAPQNQCTKQFIYSFYDSVESWTINKFIKCQKSNVDQNILYKIVHIDFSQLIELSLQSCQISSIQCIGWLGCLQTLEILSLNQNYISSLKALSKCRLKGLKQLHLNGNKFDEVETLHLSRTLMPKRLQVMCMKKNVIPVLQPDQISNFYYMHVYNKLQNQFPNYCLNFMLIKVEPKIIERLSLQIEQRKAPNGKWKKTFSSRSFFKF